MTLRLWPDVAHLTDLEKIQRDLIEAFPAEMELNLTNGVLTGNGPLVTVGTRFTHILLSKSILVGINLDIQVAHEENFNFHPETRTKAPKIFITCLVKMFASQSKNAIHSKLFLRHRSCVDRYSEPQLVRSLWWLPDVHISTSVMISSQLNDLYRVNVWSIPHRWTSNPRFEGLEIVDESMIYT